MRRLFGMLVSLIMTATMLSAGSALAVPKKNNPSTTRVFKDISTYNEAVAHSQEQMTTEAEMDHEQKLHRAKEISKALSAVGVADVAAQERIAEEYDLYIYNPNLQINDVSPSSVESNVTIYKPVIIWDNSIKWEMYHGEWIWKDMSYVRGDAPGCGDVGGVDNTGLNFSNVPDPSRIIGYYVQTYDNFGFERDYLDGRSYMPIADGKLAILFNGQDYYCYESPIDSYSWYEADIWVYFNYALSANANGTVETVYAHTWDETAVSGASFTVGGDSDNKTSWGLTFEFTRQENKWVLGSLWTSY